MRITLLLLFILISATTIQAQNPDNPSWMEMMQDPDANFFEIQESFEKYFENRERQKGDGWKVFKRWEWFWSQRINEDGSFPKPDATMEAYESWRIAYNQQLSGTESEGGTWTEVGPRMKPNNGTGQPNGNGRLNAIAFHPTDANTLWVGSPSGGLWKTTNGGTSWTSNTDDMPTLGVSSILINPNNTNIMYIGTGDRDAGDAPGLGVYKSTNGGNSWFSSNSGMGNKTVGQMVMNPDDASIILAATSTGVYRSTNSGGSWTLVNSNGNFKDMKYRPGSSSVIYATETSSGAGFWRSLDDGLTWTQISLPASGSLQRLSIGVTPDDTNVVYLVASVSSAFGGLYRSTNGGASFTTQSTTPNILTWNEYPPTSGGGGQGWYDLAIAVDPNNANTVYVGGVNIFKSTNAGVTWDCSAHWVGSSTAASVHADHHWLEYSPVDGRLYNCNDGGLYYTNNGGTSWPEISDSLGISQIYKIGVSQNTNEFVINGYQDNGTAIWDNTIFRTERGGDGMECIIDPNNDAIIYASVYYGNIARSSNYGYNFGSFAANNVNGITESGAWVTPYITSYSTSETMFIGYKNVWRTTNAYDGSPTFTAISNSLAGSNSSNMRQLRQSRVNHNRLYAVRSDNKLFRSNNALGNSPTWTDLTPNLPSGWYISDLETSPDAQNTLWIIRSNNVYKSTNGGLSWTSITGNLPNVGKNCLLADPFTDSGLYIGTDAGIYYTDNDLNNWIPFDDGFPATAEVTELEIYHVQGDWQARRIRAATYGRGLWESDLYDPGDRAPMAFAESSVQGISDCYPGTITLIHTSAYGVDSIQWQVYPSNGASFINGTTADSNYAQLTFTEAGVYDVVLYVQNANGTDTLTVVNNFVVDLLEVELTEEDSTEIYCQGDDVVLYATPGMVDYTYWKNGALYQIGNDDTCVVAQASNNDSLSVVVTDQDGCIATASIILEVNEQPEVDLTTSDEDLTICEGDTVTFISNSSTTVTHDFYLNDSLIQSGSTDQWTTSTLSNGDSIWVLVYTNVGCTDESDSIVFTVNPIPLTPMLTLGTDSIESSTLGDVYEWMFDDSLATTFDHRFAKLGDGNYSVRVNEAGCWSAWSDSLIITGINNLSSTEMKVYPSPTTDVLFIEVSSSDEAISGSVQIIDMQGRIVLGPETKTLVGATQIDVSSLPSGLYSVVISVEGKQAVFQIIKEKR